MNADDLFTTPRAETIAALRDTPGDIMVLGAGGKMGPTLATMAARAVREIGDRRRVIAVARWSDKSAAAALERNGVDVIACDLLDRAAVAKLPDASNIVFMAGQKFGTADAPSRTWAMNTLVPAHCAERFAGPDVRVVVFSTGNVYSFTPPASGGSRETDALGPVGDYAWSCVGRERVWEYFAASRGTRVAIYRLNYAIDVRYGVLLDLAQRIMRGDPVPLAMGYVNVIWQEDANRIALECLVKAANPPFVVNVTGQSALSVRELALALAKRLGKTPTFDGAERDTALLSNTAVMQANFAAPAASNEQMLDRVADWVQHGGETRNKPTHFEARDGQF